MAPYILCFLITLVFAGINEHLLNKKKQHKILIVLTALMIILIPATLAGLRDYNVGTDVALYGVPTFNAVNHKRISELGQIYALNVFSGMIEIGYFSLAFISSPFSDDPHIFLFFIAVVIGSFTYLSLYRMRKNCSILMGELVFLFLLYAESYNMMRQCLAMSISLFALTYLLEKKYKTFVIWLIVAFLFHRTAIIAASFLVVYLYIDRKIESFDKKTLIKGVVTQKKRQSSRNVIIKLTGVVVVCVIVFALFNQIVATLINIHVLPAKYVKFISSGETTDFSLHHMFDYAFMYVFLFLDYKKIKNRNFFFTIGIVDVILYLMRYRLFLMYRVSRYFMYCRTLSFSQIKLTYKRGKVSKSSLYGLAIIMLCILYWYEVIVVGGYNEVFPYTSSILGIG